LEIKLISEQDQDELELLKATVKEVEEIIESLNHLKRDARKLEEEIQKVVTEFEGEELKNGGIEKARKFKRINGS